MFRLISINKVRLIQTVIYQNLLLVMICLISQFNISTAHGDEWTDDFSSYEEGSLGNPRWSVRSIDWTVKSEVYQCNGLLDSFSIAEGNQNFREVNIEAVVTVLAPTKRDTWRIAGVSIYNNSQNFWHFALVEAPSDINKRHFLELSEKREDLWLAQENLTTTTTENMNFNWQYNQPYRLRISMTPSGIEGYLSDMNGKILARKAYAFDNTAVITGRPALHGNSMQIAFDNISVQTSNPEPLQEKAELPKLSLKTWDGIKRPATGYFYVEKIDNIWWCIAPDGNAFYAVGTDHCKFNGHWCEQLGYSPYGQKNREKYASEEIWSQQTAKRLKDWGFNLVATGHSEQMRYRGLAHTLWMGCGAEFSSISDIVPKTYWTGLPNVFDPRFATYCKLKARQVLADHVDDPWVFGIFIDNELEWYGKNHTTGGVFDEAMKKEADHTAKIALIDMLKAKYSTITLLNDSWGTNYPDFNAILQATEIDTPTVSDGLAEDKLEYLALVAEKYFAITTAVIREVDKHHMILGSRFAGDAPKPCWDAAGKYCDIVSVNQYPFIDLQTGQLPKAVSDLVRYWQWTNRPLMLTEWSFPAIDSGLPCMHGAGMRVETQQQRSLAYKIYQTTLFGLPFVVGSDFFMWVDEPALGISSTFPEDSNYGLVNEEDQPYIELTNTAAELNPKVYEIHNKAVEPDLDINSTAQAEYQKGLAWPKKLSDNVIRYPIVVSNNTNSNIKNGIISFILAEIDPKVKWHDLSADSLCLKNDKDQDIIWQLDSFDNILDLNDEICFRAPNLETGKHKTYFLYVNRPANRIVSKTNIDCMEFEKGFEISNNKIKLLKNEPDGDFVDAFYYDKMILGRYNPMVHQNQGQHFWARSSELIDYKISKGPLRALVHMIAKGGDAGTINTTETILDKPLAFVIEHRMAIYPDRPWFDTRFVRITNQSNTEMNLCDSFFYIVPGINGDASDEDLIPKVPNYYQKNFNLWRDPTGYEYGALATGDSDLRVTFYINPQGGKHPDAMLRFEPPVKIKAHDQFEQFDSPSMHIIGYHQDTQNTSLPQALLENIQEQYALQIHFMEAERQNTKQ